MPSCLLALTLLLMGCGAKSVEPVELTGRTMGTSYSIKLAATRTRRCKMPCNVRSRQRLHDINAQMSTYLADSDLMRFNRNSSTEWLAAPPELVELVEQANRIAHRPTACTTSPSDHWSISGALATPARSAAPPEQEVTALLKQTGYQHLQARRSPPALRKDVAGLQVDLSSIAKGWAVDQLARL